LRLEIAQPLTVSYDSVTRQRLGSGRLGLAATAWSSAWTWFCGAAGRPCLLRARPGHFAGFVMFDFQRLRANTDITVAPPLAASISSTCWTSSCSSSRSSPAKRN